MECGRLVGTSGLSVQKGSLEEYRKEIKYRRKSYERDYI
jgi:hypothetical protein